MDWTQTVTIMATTIGSVFACFSITDRRIEKLEEKMEKLDEKFTVTIQHMDSKFTNALQHMDEKWERLFERLLLQDQQKVK